MLFLFLSLPKYYPYKCSSLNLYRTLCMIYQTTLLQQLSVIASLSPNLFIHSRVSSSDKFHIKHSRLTQQRNSFTRFGAKAWNCFPSQMCKLHKPVFKKKIREALFVVCDTEDECIEASVLLRKMNRHLK